MPAYNAGAPRTDPIDPSSAPVANPGELGAAVIMSPFSGPAGSPMDAMQYPADVYMPVLADREAADEDASTGGLSTGIGFGPNACYPGIGQYFSATDPSRNGLFMDSYVPGVTMPDGSTAATEAILLAIGGGQTEVVPDEADDATDFSRALAETDPLDEEAICAFGNGALRDDEEGAAGTGLDMKLVTASSDVAAEAVIETGFENRQGGVLKSGLHQFGVATATPGALATGGGEPHTEPSAAPKSAAKPVAKPTVKAPAKK